MDGQAASGQQDHRPHQGLLELGSDLCGGVEVVVESIGEAALQQCAVQAEFEDFTAAASGDDDRLPCVPQAAVERSWVSASFRRLVSSASAWATPSVNGGRARRRAAPGAGMAVMKARSRSGQAARPLRTPMPRAGAGGCGGRRPVGCWPSRWTPCPAGPWPPAMQGRPARVDVGRLRTAACDVRSAPPDRARCSGRGSPSRRPVPAQLCACRRRSGRCAGSRVNAGPGRSGSQSRSRSQRWDTAVRSIWVERPGIFLPKCSVKAYPSSRVSSDVR